MSARGKTCSKCGSALFPKSGIPGVLECQTCGKQFAVRSSRETPPVGRPAGAAAACATLPAAPSAFADLDSGPPAPGPAQPRSASGHRLMLVMTLSAFFLGTGAVLAVYCFRENGSGHRPAPAAAGSGASRRSAAAPGSDEDWQGAVEEVRRQASEPTLVVVRREPSPEEVRATAAAKRVNQAIDRGVDYLKHNMTGPVRAQAAGHPIGTAALAGLTMLECGVAANDPAVREAVRDVRAAMQDPRRRARGNSYELALVILFLDRLGEPEDRDLILKVALRLIAGQKPRGGWDYFCPLLTPEQEKELFALLKPGATMPQYTTGAPATEDAPGVNPRFLMMRTKLPANLKDLPVFQYKPGTRIENETQGHEDNSLTQFAILALWAARKHEIPVERSLMMAEARFRTCQNPDGSWGYTWGSTARKDSMTCAGLLGLAIGRGLSKRGTAPEKDPDIDKGLISLGQNIGKAPLLVDPDRARKLDEYAELSIQLRKATTNDERRALQSKILGLGIIGTGMKGTLVGADSWGDLYYLWSIERMAMVFDLKTIAGKDWYAWGSEIILNAQLKDGSWADTFPGIPDTCFALLFLKRVNVVKDLTNQLQLLGKIKDPGSKVQ